MNKICGKGAGASILRRFDNIRVDDLHTYTDNELNNLILAINSIPLQQQSAHQRRLMMNAIIIRVRNEIGQQTPSVTDDESDTSSMDVETEGTGIGPMFLRGKRELSGIKKGIHYGIIGYD